MHNAISWLSGLVVNSMLEKKSAAPHSQKETAQETEKNKIFKIVGLFLDLPLLQVLDPVTWNQ